MTNEMITQKIMAFVSDYKIKKVTLFGSRATQTHSVESDVDLIIEFFEDVSLLRLSELRCKLEDALGVEVDIVHGPVQPGDMIEVGKEVELYAA